KAGITEAVKVFKAGKEVEGEKWEFVSSHTARRSFATNLYLRGADLYSISQMMGHASVEMTQNYLCCGLREQSAQVMEYFK
ncbi:tyrosine-type recombinase/integrase, partial [Bacteroides intestinalis]